jgi:uncharacterized protein
MSKLFVNSNELHKLSNKLGNKVLEYKPDVIVGVTRGGCFPSIIIHELLNYKGNKCEYFVISTKSYNEDNVRGNNVFIDISEYTMNRLKKCERILIVDDVFDSGYTCMEIGNYLYKCGSITSDKYKFATVFYKPNKNKTTIIPDYYMNTTEDWIVFPHELIGL